MENHAVRSLIPLGIVLFTVLGIVTTVPDLSSGRPDAALDLETLEPHADRRSVVAHLLEDPLLKPMAAFRKQAAERKARRDVPCEQVMRERMAAELKEALEHADFLPGDEATLIVVPAQTGHSTEDREKRVRLRYAAMSALRTTGYVPVAKSHLRWSTFPLKHDGKTDAGIAVYEMFKPDRDLQLHTHCSGEEWSNLTPLVIVVWIADHQIREGEYEAYEEVTRCIQLGTGDALGDPPRVRIIGPTSSDALRGLQASREWSDKDTHGFRVISPWATAATESFGSGLNSRRALLGGRLDPVIGDDAELVEKLTEELRIRRALQHGDSVLLVCEWDTVYGRGLANRFKEAARAAHVTDIDVAYYTKQVDPAADPLQAEESKKPGSVRSKPNRDTEISVGDSQLDYVRRLTRRVRSTNRDYAAVGIFGTDTFDKLIILRALRKLQANAVFFTTDLDDRFMHPRQLPYTRNLVVASHYGLELAPNLQGDTMPFRGCYQTAAYLGFLAVFCPRLIDDIGSLDPQIYEISRAGAYELSALGRRTGGVLPPAPADERRLFLLSIWRVLFVVGALLLLVFLMLLGMFNRRVARRRNPCAPRVIAGAVLIGLLVVFGYSFFSSQGGTGEPFEWFNGISAWPAVLLRIVVTGVGVGYVWNAYQETVALRRMQARSYKLPRRVRKAPPTRFYRRCFALLRPRFIRRLWRTIAIQTWRDRTGDTARLFRGYLRRETAQARFLRVCCGVVPVVAIMIAVHYLPRTSILAWPRSPVRGSGAFFWSSMTLWPSLIAMLTVSVFVLDATALEGRLMQLVRLKSLKWNPELVRRESVRRGISERATSLILWVELLRDRSTVVSRFLYDPFIVFALMMLIHNNAFDNFRTPPALVLAFLAGLGITWWAGFTMRRAAIQTKDRIAQELNGVLQGIRSAEGFRSDPANSMKASIDEIEAIDVGAFGNLRSHPIFGALAIPVGGIGTIQLLNMLG